MQQGRKREGGGVKGCRAKGCVKQGSKRRGCCVAGMAEVGLQGGGDGRVDGTPHQGDGLMVHIRGSVKVDGAPKEEMR